MALRIKDAQPVATPGRDSTATRPPIGLIGGVVFLVVMAVVVTWLLMRNPSAGGQTAGESNEPVRDVPVGLEQGEASADYSLATKELHDVPRGFPRTVAGAVEAATAMDEPMQFVSADRPRNVREELLTELLPPEALTPEVESVLVERARQLFGLDARGRPLEGQPGDRFINECLPEYGLYRVTGTIPGTGAPDLVEMDLWVPCIRGVGSSTHIDDLQIDWGVDYNAVEWRDEDWRMTADLKAQAREPIKPADDLRPNVSAAERAQLVADRGDGWMLYQGWSEDWPTELLGEEPR